MEVVELVIWMKGAKTRRELIERRMDETVCR